MPDIYSPIPNSPFYSPPSYSVSTSSGDLVLGSGLAVTSQGVILSASALGGTVTSVSAGTGLSGGTITTTGTINLVPATNSSLGGIRVGSNLTIDVNGVLSALPPGTGTISGVTAGNGLQGGGITGNVLLSLLPASATQFGGVSIGSGINVSTGTISVADATTTLTAGVRLATSAEVLAGTNPSKAVTPATLASKVASTTAPGLVQLSDSVSTNDSTKAATQTAAKTAYDAAVAAQATASAALPLSGGTMTGTVTFAAGQTFPGVAFPVATTSSLGVVQIGSGLNISAGGTLSTANNGTVTSVIAGPGLGAPATNNPITTSGTIRLLPPTSTDLGGVKAGTNVSIGVDGTISVPSGTFLSLNNPYSYDGYVWPVANATPALPCPGANGQVLTIADNITGELAWTDTGTLTAVLGSPAVSVFTSAGTATVSLEPVATITAGGYGATGLIPTFAVNAYGQLTSVGLANPYAPFQTATIGAPPSLVLDFSDNNTNWQWTLLANLTISNPVNVQSGQTGSLRITQGSATSSFITTWGTSWKFAGGVSYTGGGVPASSNLIQFTVVSATEIVVTNVITDYR